MRITTLETLLQHDIGTAGRPLSRAAIESYQAEALYQLVEYCRLRSPFYRSKLAEFDNQTISSLDGLSALPLTSETELREQGHHMLCVSQDEVARIISLPSSGTTGAAKRLFFTEDDLERTRLFFRIGMGNLAEPGQKAAILLPGATPDSTGYLLAGALQAMDVRSEILGLVSDPVAVARQLVAGRFDVLIGFPIQLLAVARVAEARKMELPMIRSVLLCSDYIPKSVSTALAASFGCEVFSHYGTVESGLGGAVDCAMHCGMHIRETDLLIEVIDPKTGYPLADGRWGEIVLTTLQRRAMPLVRYQTGDLGRLLVGTCPCGSTIRRLDKVKGRISLQRKLRSGAWIDLPTLDEVLFGLPGLIDFSAAIDENAGQDRLCLTLQCLPGHEDATVEAAGRLLAGQPQLCGVHVQVEHDSGYRRLHQGKRQLFDQREFVCHETACSSSLLNPCR
ncbi:DVU_1553 family AMP-dependent CoA ligase [Desulfobulbus oligotrophicus]|uniref:Phenylacetate--CoA ligase family protein n=1 Tax=Desulfobulbus oligotrophicus TaxID=1909699 RepID=A0A7T5VCD7_9BACT|nr:phenylacetate--CoA ligase family protein [Desulfobulbus oligotrophicus]QQG65236.1 phenylacetate--CoA ligase family protein [Desulfobulbus oligotrophicus]